MTPTEDQSRDRPGRSDRPNRNNNQERRNDKPRQDPHRDNNSDNGDP